LELINKIAFKDLIEKYEALFFDAYGVLNDAGGVLPGVHETLRYLNKINKTYFIVSNDSSNMPNAIARKYRDQDGTALVREDQIVCSGMIAAEYLTQTHPGGTVAYFGEGKSSAYLSSAKTIISVSELNEQDCCDAFVLLGCGGMDWRTGLDICVNYLRMHEDCELLAPNPDLVFYAGSGRVGLAAGSLASMLSSALKREFKYFGKPYGDIFEFALTRAKETIPGLTHRQVLMVGDNLDTDILGAHRVGLDSFLVMSGNTIDFTKGSDSNEVVPTYIGDSVSIS